jgi:hypothetical protein
MMLFFKPGLFHSKILPLRRLKSFRCQWLTPVILATPEAEIRRITVQDQPMEIVSKTLSQKNSSQKGGWCWWNGSRCRP